ncbi:MAG: MiaB/RimO family radical SAM methylthiotransferase [Candidatus Margulisbacteria bacterium]|nr:MiaB/RimO family radical SAM methylthiotransferase [Candidatus Margulisiibacteriota bacterium]
MTEPGRDLPKDFPHVDIFIAPNQPERLVEFLKLGGVSSKEYALSRKIGESITKYITIMHGCDNFCSYCVVPYVRGREFSRPMDEILEEIKQTDFNQYKEIFLLGQNVNSYKYGLADLLHKTEAFISHDTYPISRIRFMTSHPKDMVDDIINAVADLPHVCEYFHLPVQHGDDDMLKKMNRGYNLDYYRKLIAKIRAKIPGAAITSDVIIGYPGETDQQFANTLKIIREISFDACNTAAYSVRPGTAAAKLADDVPDQVKQQRLQQAMLVVDEVTQNNNNKLLGTVQEVLVDKKGTGRTRTNKIVKFTPNKSDLLGQLVNVKIATAKSWLLQGDLLNG